MYVCMYVSLYESVCVCVCVCVCVWLPLPRGGAVHNTHAISATVHKARSTKTTTASEWRSDGWTGGCYVHRAVEVCNRNNLPADKVVETVVGGCVDEAVANPDRSLDLLLNLTKRLLVDGTLDALIANGLPRRKIRSHDIGVVLEDVVSVLCGDGNHVAGVGPVHVGRIHFNPEDG